MLSWAGIDSSWMPGRGLPSDEGNYCHPQEILALTDVKIGLEMRKHFRKLTNVRFIVRFEEKSPF